MVRVMFGLGHTRTRLVTMSVTGDGWMTIWLGLGLLELGTILFSHKKPTVAGTDSRSGAGSDDVIGWQLTNVGGKIKRPESRPGNEAETEPELKACRDQVEAIQVTVKSVGGYCQVGWGTERA